LLLRQCFEKKALVRVFIRRAAGLRGSCVGYVKAFDKHFNMVLSDVREEYTLFEYFDESDEEDDEPSSDQSSKSRSQLPTGLNVAEGFDAPSLDSKKKKTRRRRVEVPHTRHVNQLFIRGDGVVMIHEEHACFRRS